MTEKETVEQVDDIETLESIETNQLEKEGAARGSREYSQEYFEELRAAAKEYLPKTVWDHIHAKARNKAGGRSSGKSKREAAASAAASTTEAGNAQSAEAVQQPPEVEAQLQEARQQTHKESTEKQDLHADCQKVAENCMKMKKEELESTDDVDKAAHGKLNAPVAEAGTWDAGAAQKRLLEWAGGPDKEKVDWGKFGKGFLYHDASAPDNITSYKFPIADVQGGKLVINRSALAAAAGRINQSSGISPAELDSMKAALRSHYKDLGVDAPANVAKEEEPEAEVEKADVGPVEFVGSQPLITFVAASPGVIESLRKSALVGPAGRIFDEQYLKPMGITRDDISITYLIPRLLKDEAGKVREPTSAEISKESYWRDEQQARREAPSEPITVALGHTVKKTLGSEVAVTLPHPNALGMPRTNQELVRKREQLKKMIQAKLNYADYGRLRQSLRR